MSRMIRPCDDILWPLIRDHTHREIAHFYGVSIRTVEAWAATRINGFWPNADDGLRHPRPASDLLLSLVAEGRTHREISEFYKVSPRTVERWVHDARKGATPHGR
ncbi:helix-turn-helix domain-containing protein [Olsenella sp. AM30-3LB]|uniref:helix-turn-helix domain-containing protein n=1 Tax=Olsenella sp. AM30-3LB TaxID=2292359 RepID=UPI001314BD09|nr:helix-turn-helix domain-containing protein [Olsenella sp. AM30-3LB]